MSSGLALYRIKRARRPQLSSRCGHHTDSVRKAPQARRR